MDIRFNKNKKVRAVPQIAERLLLYILITTDTENYRRLFKQAITRIIRLNEVFYHENPDIPKISYRKADMRKYLYIVNA